jgi:hypothetical protein
VEEGRLTLPRRARAAAAAALVVAAELAAPTGTTWLSLLDASVGMAFAPGAAAVAGVSGRTADLALAVAVSWGLGTLAAVGDLPEALVLLHRAPLAVLVLTYPGGHLRSLVGRSIALAAAVAPFAPPEARSWTTAAVTGIAALAAAVDTARTAPVLRPPRAAAALAGAAMLVAAVLGAAEAADATALLVAYDITLLATAAILLGPITRERWSAAAASGLVIELEAGPPGAPITAGLAEVLRDPTLELRLRAPGASWTDEAGHPAPEPQEHARSRAVTSRVLADGTEVALLHDNAAIADHAAAESAVAVAATGVENARQEREVRKRIEQLRTLRRAVLAAVDDERRLLEDELQLGPLREADRLDELLGGLPAGRADTLRQELAVARAELMEIARGLYPAALARDGLTASLMAVADRAPLPVEFDARVDAPVPEPIALTAYYVVSEALANVAKHAGAATARIELVARGPWLIVRVLDDGSGGADTKGGGLRGLRDRVTTVDGVLRVVSPPGDGTVIEARLPLRNPPRAPRAPANGPKLSNP